MTLLDVQDLSVRFRAPMPLMARLRRRGALEIEVLRNVSFSLGRGETLALVGESGSGKTTLGRAINGLVRPSAGKMSFDGVAVTAKTDGEYRALRRQIAMMFQDPIASLSPRLTVAQLIGEPLRIHGLEGVDPSAVAMTLLDRVGLVPAIASRYPHQLSGGQARRVTVARSLAVPPKLVICDEPTAGLDVSVQAEILNLMTELQDRLGLSYLIITHNLAVARHVSHRIAVMYLGQIVETGPSAEIFAGPRHPYTAGLLGSEPTLDPVKRAKRLRIQGDPPSVLNRPTGCAFHPRCPFASDLCRSVDPAETILAPGHSVRCHHPVTADAA
jgi:peptide/nickel transport system ATP-binding protein